MRIGFVVNDVFTEKAKYTTTRLAMAATNRGHEVWHMGLGDFTFEADDNLSAHAHTIPEGRHKSLQVYAKALLDPETEPQRISVNELDVLMLRADPSEETGSRAWARWAGIDFGRIAVKHGVIVLNDPNGLSQAMNKMYLEYFPEPIRPRSIISRDEEEIRQFAHEHDWKIVIKPLLGSGGRGVFLVTPENRPNLNQMVESISRDGYVIAQEYLPAAAEGDTRLFLLNGEPFMHRGKYAAFRRLRSPEDIRSNIRAGGTKAKADITDTHLRIADSIRPKLIEDGMFLVGVDIAGDKVMEINVFTPGGLGSTQEFEGVNFCNGVIGALEHKVTYMSDYQRKIDNVELATL